MTSNDIAGRVLALSDTDLTVEDPADDIRGRTVCDSNGEEIGKVEDLLIDDREKRVRFLRVGTGGFLGMGKDHFLMPVDAITSVEPEVATISMERARLGDAPAYDPELMTEPESYSGVYNWWGYSPYWGLGYAYPRYPYYR